MSTSLIKTTTGLDRVSKQIAITNKLLAGIGNRDFIEMVTVEGGTFLMGSNDGEDNEKPVHKVTLSSYKIGKYPITQAQWKAIMGNNPSEFKDWDKCLVNNVSWDDLQEFLHKLNTKTGKTYRLPTEAEWEFAARGGNNSKGYMYSGSNDIDEVGWYRENSGGKTHPVGQKIPNELGLYDMSGNVGEWCNDWYGTYCSAVTDPQGPATGGPFRVLRGGSWFSYANYCRIARRDLVHPAFHPCDNGFRVAFVP